MKPRAETVREKCFQFPKSRCHIDHHRVLPNTSKGHSFCVLQCTGKSTKNSSLSVTPHCPSLPGYGAVIWSRNLLSIATSNAVYQPTMVPEQNIAISIYPFMFGVASQIVPLIWDHSQIWEFCWLIQVKLDSAQGASQPPLGQTGHLPVAISEIQEHKQKFKCLLMPLLVSGLLTSL